MRLSPSLKFSSVRACLLVVIGLLLTAPTARAEARLRSGVSVLVQFGVGGIAPTVGPALAFDLGGVPSTEWAVAAKLSVGGILMFNMVRLGVGAEYSPVNAGPSELESRAPPSSASSETCRVRCRWWRRFASTTRWVRWAPNGTGGP
jgi:hypothetical protein